MSTLSDASPSLNIAPPSYPEDSPALSRRGEVHVGSCKQLVPTIISLIETAIQLPSIHEDIAEGTEQARKDQAEANEAMREERDRWAAEKKESTDVRDEAAEVDKVAMAALGDKAAEYKSPFDMKGWKAEVSEARRLSAPWLTLLYS